MFNTELLGVRVFAMVGLDLREMCSTTGELQVCLLAEIAAHALPGSETWNGQKCGATPNRVEVISD